MVEPKLFSLIRGGDESGVSGTGRVLDGVVFPTGKVVVCWRADTPMGISSIAIHESLEAFTKIHITSHPNNKSRLVWL